MTTKVQSPISQRRSKAVKPSQKGAPPSGKAKISAENLRALATLKAWDRFSPEEVEEQKETWKFLQKALDEDRLSPQRPFFSDEAA